MLAPGYVNPWGYCSHRLSPNGGLSRITQLSRQIMFGVQSNPKQVTRIGAAGAAYSSRPSDIGHRTSDIGKQSPEWNRPPTLTALGHRSSVIGHLPSSIFHLPSSISSALLPASLPGRAAGSAAGLQAIRVLLPYCRAVLVSVCCHECRQRR